MKAGAPRTNLLTQISEYWAAYGGAKSVIRSEFFWLSLALTAITFGVWREPNWWELVLQTVPTLLGLSLAALTLFLGVGSEGFRETIAGNETDDSEPSPFRKTAAVFVHFLVIQSAALFFAFAASAAYKVEAPPELYQLNEAVKPIFWFICYFFFVYSLFTVLAAAFAIFEVVHWFDCYVTRKCEIATLKDGHCCPTCNQPLPPPPT